MFTQGGIDIDGFHTRVEMCHHITNGRQLWVGAALRLVGTIELGSGGDNHTIDVHLVAKHLFIFIGSLGITHAALRTTAIRHQRTYLVTLADDDNAFVGNLRIFVGIDMILIIGDGHTVRLLLL